VDHSTTFIHLDCQFHLKKRGSQVVSSQIPNALTNITRSFFHIKCHWKDISKFKFLQSKENKMLAATWYFYQMTDGLNSEGGMPMVCISVLNQGSSNGPALIALRLHNQVDAEMVLLRYSERDGIEAKDQLLRICSSSKNETSACELSHNGVGDWRSVRTIS
jgi:hypothetical protein